MNVLKDNSDILFSLKTVGCQHPLEIPTLWGILTGCLTWDWFEVSK